YGVEKGFKGKSVGKGNQKRSDDLKEKSNARLNNMLGKIRKENKNQKHGYSLLSEPDDLIRAVNSLIDELNIDMMVLGNKGEQSSIPVFLGSTTTDTLESVKKCPVLTVPNNAKFTVPKEIALASDFKKSYDASVLLSVRTMANLCGAALRIVHIDEEEKLDDHQKFNLDSLLTFFGPLAHSVERIPNFISKTKIIQLFLEKSDIDMLCMVGYEHGLLEKMLREPVIENMVLKIDIPFFIVPETP
ncbi:hypothetical protein LCGC14_1481290, partial [marine sediment metagenome]